MNETTQSFRGGLSAIFKAFFGVSLIFFALVLIRLPILLNADSHIGADEASNAIEILDFLRGGPLFFHHEDGRYYGIIDGLMAIPFFWVFGETALAYKLPPVLFYSLYVWTLYLLAGKVSLTIGRLTLVLSLFTSKSSSSPPQQQCLCNCKVVGGGSAG